MIPTTYTYETYRDYLEKEILQKVAVSLGWTDKAAVPQTTYTFTNGKWDANNKIFYPLSPTPVNLYAGQIFSGSILGANTKLVRSAVKGSTGLIFKALGGTVSSTNSWSTGTISVTLPAEAGVDSQVLYDSITNETLMLMGYSTPESVPTSEIAEFRMVGRVEAWRAVVYNTVADSDVVLVDNLLNRSQVNDFALNQLEYAQSDLDKEFPFLKPSLGKPRAMSYAGKITVRF